VHILATWIDPFTRFSWNEIFIPLTSHYRPEWMAFGIVALYLGIAIGISTWLRPHIGYKLWRQLHILTLGVFALATIHGIGSGSDTQTPWALGIYLASTILVGLLLCRRLFLSKRKNKKTAQAHSLNPNRSVKATEMRIPEQRRTEAARLR
jgi:predicted ferric reductase